MARPLVRTHQRQSDNHSGRRGVLSMTRIPEFPPIVNTCAISHLADLRRQAVEASGAAARELTQARDNGDHDAAWSAFRRMLRHADLAAYLVGLEVTG